MSTPAERREVYGTKRWLLLRLSVLEAANRRCAVCGRAGADTVDHLKPLRAGGDPWDPDNLRAVCRPCHSAKHSAGRRPAGWGVKAFLKERGKVLR